MNNKHEKWQLRSMQSANLNTKILLTKTRIREWIKVYGEDGVYVSFSGGKDSTVLLHIARQIYPNMRAMFVDVPTQYPELKEFAMSFDNVDIVKPKITFMDVCAKYGFPLISKEVAQTIYEERIYLTKGHDKPSYRAKKLDGTLIDKKTGKRSSYNISQYKYLLDAPFSISHECCKVMKKAPAKRYEKETGRHPITAQMAEESRLRESQWLKSGCNGFDLKRPVSNPMAFWTEQDVLTYIHTYSLPICSVYGDVVVDYETEGNLDGQMAIFLNEGERPLKTTGCKRTGCMLCGFGCHLEESPNRFELLKETHPKMYNLVDVVKNNGVTFRQAIEWINEHSNTNIKI